jgi:hypothetical protein
VDSTRSYPKTMSPGGTILSPIKGRCAACGCRSGTSRAASPTGSVGRSFRRSGRNWGKKAVDPAHRGTRGVDVSARSGVVAFSRERTRAPIAGARLTLSLEPSIPVGEPRTLSVALGVASVVPDISRPIPSRELPPQRSPRGYFGSKLRWRHAPPTMTALMH